MSNVSKTSSQPTPNRIVPAAKLVRCEICGQVFDSRNVGELVHHSLMGPGHKPLPH